MEQWGEQMPLVDWLVRLAAGLWEAGCHSGPDTVLELRVGTALTMDLHALALCLQSQAEGSGWAV